MNNAVLFLAILLSAPITSLLAEDFYNCGSWYGVCGVEVGAVMTSNAGRSKIFPITEPNDEFYEYSSHHKSRTKVVYGGFVGAEWRGLTNCDIQFDIRYNQSSPFSINGILTQGIDVQSADSYRYKYKIEVRQLLLEAKFSYVNCTQFRPYALVGIGSSFNKSYSFSTTVPDLLTFTRTYKSKTVSGFTYTLGAGVDMEISRCVYIGASYRFTDFGKAALGSSSIDGEAVSGTLSQNNFYANQVFAQLTFLF